MNRRFYLPGPVGSEPCIGRGLLLVLSELTRRVDTALGCRPRAGRPCGDAEMSDLDKEVDAMVDAMYEHVGLIDRLKIRDQARMLMLNTLAQRAVDRRLTTWTRAKG